MKIFFLTALILIGGLYACDSTRIYEKNKEFENKLWLADSAVSFQFKIDNSKIRYNLFYNIRNTINYPYHNLYIQYSLTNAEGKKIAGSLMGKDLFDPKTGKPYGSGLGDIFDHQFGLLSKHKFNRVGEYNLELKQYMRMDTLPDILAVGFRLERVTETE